LWVSLFRLFGIMGNAQCEEELLTSWRDQLGSHCNLEVWRMAPL